MINFDVIIIGAGAAGLMCAIEAGRRGRNVLVIEHAEKAGKKILISGGGRCNFTNIYASHENYICSNPHFHKSALARYTPHDFISLVEKHGIKYHEKKLGQLFCSESSRQIVEMLEAECRKANVKIALNCKISSIEKNEAFEIKSNTGGFTCSSLVVACGGASIPKMGASEFGYKLAKQFGLKLVEYVPALVPLTMDEKHLKKYGILSGVSMDSEVSLGEISFRENILFTHRGFSGPAILQISSYWKHGETITINLLPATDILNEFHKNPENNTSVINFLPQFLPKRFLEAWCGEPVFFKPVSRLTEAEAEKIKHALGNWQVKPSGTEGFAKAEVTTGGVSTDELSSKTMESKKVGGLYFIGEVVDVTGWLGGYNFQWAWASGYAAGQYV
jgi:predicted Rossmann fold flavoprotein